MKILIIGNGIAGTTAARYIRKYSNARITIISSETSIFFSRTALMYIYMGHLRFEDTQPYAPWFWKKNQINLLQDYVEHIDPEKKEVLLSSGNTLQYDKLVLSTGSNSNKFGWPGQNLEGVQGLYSYQDLQLLEQNTTHCETAVIVGGGLIGIELAEMLLSRNINVLFLVREASFWDIAIPPEESAMINRHIKEHHIDLRLSTELKEIISDESGRVKAIKTTDGEVFTCQFVGLTPGVHPNLKLAKRCPQIETDKGILVNEYFETSVSDIYAIGDCAEMRTPPEGRRPIEPVWYVGKIMGKQAARNICGMQTAYSPGIWFNSAKFLDIEYQVYGKIDPNVEDPLRTFYVEWPCGKKSIRINYDSSDSDRVIGFNLMGIRFRHLICDRWIQEKRDLFHVITHLEAAVFEPEFFPDIKKLVHSRYKKEFPNKEITPARKRQIRELVNSVSL